MCRHSLCHLWIDWRSLFAPIHLGHAHVALVTLLGHILASVEEVGGFSRVLLHDGSKADFAFQVILEASQLGSLESSENGFLPSASKAGLKRHKCQ